MEKQNKKCIINLSSLFEGTENSQRLDIAKYQCIEEVFKIIIKICSVYLIFLIMNWVGEYLTKHEVLQQGGFNSDVLFSVFVLPLLYSLKDIKNCFDSLFVKVWKDETSLTVKRGFLANKYDKLYFEDVNNIELYRSFGGKILGYSTVDLYAFGGILTLPYLRDTHKNKEVITLLIQKAQQS